MPTDLIDEISKVYIEADLLCSENEVDQAIQQIASQIERDMAKLNPLVISVMNGALVFSGQLLPKLNFPLQVDYLHATRYRNHLEGKHLEWKAHCQNPITGRHVLLLDDILDEGVTLARIKDYCLEQQVASVRIAVLVNKEHERREEAIEADYIGLSVADRYVFGFGMDYKGYWRNAPGIYAIRES